MLLVPGRCGKRLANSLSGDKVRVAQVKTKKFANGEQRVKILADLAGEECMVVLGVGPEVDELLMEALLLIDACRIGGARKVRMLVPFLPYSFQNREIIGEPVSVRVVARLLSESGVEEVRVVDLHQERTAQLFRIPLMNVSPLSLWEKWVGRAKLDDGAVVVAPDKGAVRRARELARTVGLPLVELSKKRDLESLEVSGLKVKEGKLGQEAILVDDAINSGRTVVEVSRFLREEGVVKITWLVTHVLPVVGAVERVLAEVDRLVVTDSVEHGLESGGKVEVLALTAKLLM